MQRSIGCFLNKDLDRVENRAALIKLRKYAHLLKSLDHAEALFRTLRKNKMKNFKK